MNIAIESFPNEQVNCAEANVAHVSADLHIRRVMLDFDSQVVCSELTIKQALALSASLLDAANRLVS